MTSDVRVGASRSVTDEAFGRDAPIPFGRLVAVEMRKSVDTRAAKAVLGTFIVLGVLILVLALVNDPDASLATAALPATLLVAGFPVIGVMVMTSEWGQRTAVTTFRLVPRRSRVLAAKVAAALVVSLATVTVLLVVCLSITAVALAARGGSVTAMGVGEEIRLAYVSVLTATLFGLAWGALLRSTPVALVFTIVASLVADLALRFALGDLARWFTSDTSATWLLGEESFSLAAVTSAAIWYLVPLVVGCWLQTRWEVR